ncbi:MAG: 30S ribosomal protein S7 [Candidatus Melainabacteria bacterium]|nr:30S ribosomal protein S7 [Candidatus Melainabacteria bacterium]
MSRRNKPEKRVILPDPVYGDVKIAKFINRLMLRGKKSVAENILYTALESLDGKTDDKPLAVFHKAMTRVRPIVRVKARRVGGSTYQVPLEVDEDQGEAIASRWIIQYARQRAGRTMADKLASELLDAYRGHGASIKKREDTHKMAEANKAFAHYRF